MSIMLAANSLDFLTNSASLKQIPGYSEQGRASVETHLNSINTAELEKEGAKIHNEIIEEASCPSKVADSVRLAG